MTRDILLARWSEVGDKIITMAEAFPEARYDARPLPEVRSFAEQLRHVAFWNAYAGRTLRGEPADGEANELPRDAYPTKAEIVPALRETFDAVKSELASRTTRRRRTRSSRSSSTAGSTTGSSRCTTG